jgi:hypothetical protein
MPAARLTFGAYAGYKFLQNGTVTSTTVSRRWQAVSRHWETSYFLGRDSRIPSAVGHGVRTTTTNWLRQECLVRCGIRFTQLGSVLGDRRGIGL